MKKKIVSTHIENDVVNNSPTVVYTDEDGVEWINSSWESARYLIKKEGSWYFQPKEKHS